MEPDYTKLLLQRLDDMPPPICPEFSDLFALLLDIRRLERQLAGRALRKSPQDLILNQKFHVQEGI